MRRLPLYDLPALAAVERERPVELEQGCTRCHLGQRPERKRCMTADGEPGGLLVVGDYANAEDERLGRPLTSKAGQLVRQLVGEFWDGPVAYDVAIRCPLPKEATPAKIDAAVNACRGHLSQVIAEVKPKRILALGSQATQALLGMGVNAASVRGGYGWLWSDGRGVPVYLLPAPFSVVRNTFQREWIREDIRRACAERLPSRPPWRDSVQVIETREDAVIARMRLGAQRWVAFDCETFGRMHTPEFRLLCVAVAAQGQTDCAYVWGAEALADAGARRELMELLTDSSVGKVAHNAKFDVQAVRLSLGVEPAPISLDTRLARKLIDPDAESKLAVVAFLVGMGGHKAENERFLELGKKALRQWAVGKASVIDALDVLIAKATRIESQLFSGSVTVGAPTAVDGWFTDEIKELCAAVDADRLATWAYSLVPQSVLLRYCALDTVTTVRAGELIEEELCERPEAALTWAQLVRPASWAITHVELWGIRADASTIRAYSALLGQRIDAARVRLEAYAPGFQPDSLPQVRELLFKTLGLKAENLTDSGLEATDATALQALAGKHPAVDDLLEYRKLAKLRGTYADGLLEHIRSDERIHASYNIDGARSGRLSSSAPNLQNLPRATTPEGKMIRDAFLPTPGWTFVEADYSQLELRVAAILTGDPEMTRLYQSGADFHQQTARYIAPTVWGIQPDEVTKEHRTKAKTFVFGIIYGMTDNGIVQRTGCTRQEAAAIREAVMGKFRVLDRWIKNQIRNSTREGGCWTYWHGQRARWRPLTRLGDLDTDSAQAASQRNASFNSPIQGSANEYCLASLVAIVRWILDEKFPARVVSTIHDSIMLETPTDRVPELRAKMREIMTGWPTGDVPLVVDFKIGQSWGAMQEIHD